MSASPTRRSRRAYSLISQRLRQAARTSSTCSRPASCSPPTARPIARAIEAVVPADVELRRHAQSDRRAGRRRCSRICSIARRPPRSTRPCAGRARHHRQVPVHLGLDRHAEGRDQHPAHVVLEPGDDPHRARLSSRTSRRSSSTGRRGTTPSAAITMSASCSTTAARSISTRASRCRARSTRRCAICARSRRPGTSPCRRASRRCCRICATDAQLRQHLLQPPEGAVVRGRRLAQHVFDEMKELAIETCGERILFLTGFGSTETAPLRARAHLGQRATPPIWACRRPAWSSSWCRREGKLEARVRGPNITPGYWRAAGADRARRSTRKASTGSATRSGSPIRPIRAPGPAVRRPHRRGLQARRPAPGSASARCARG